MRNRLSPFLGAVILAAVPGKAEPVSAPQLLDDLVARSPFGATPAAEANAGATAAAALEFRGYFVDHGDSFFSIYDPATRVASWVGLKEEGQAFVVQAYDAERAEITLKHQGKTAVIALKRARVIAATMPPPAAAGAANPPPAGGAPAAATVPGVVVGVDLEPRKMSAVAEEIRRRRALREASRKEGAKPNVEFPAPTPETSR